MEEQLISMSDTFISFETAKLGKEKGFDIETERLFVNYYYGNPEPPLLKWKNVTNEWYKEQLNFMSTVYYQPTQSLLQKWLREVYGVHIQVYVMEQWLENGNEMEIYFEVNLKTTQNIGGLKNVKSNMIKFKSYEEALEVGLHQALLLL